ncbi:DUF4442 domain-containing protein [Veronia nyctiphanis]|uniref:DUF4442 domain-containing protein n=1 Tax=Veronia nyctiphanis TaxID=1278244 RepID=A0A4Q0YNI2_9GAMM|nr:hotdog fold domain-containing protein [Veronia nyctiphanis]RXJ72416.1 DUF4442 domain-containing protein [Veronia nyctiphanis]
MRKNLKIYNRLSRSPLGRWLFDWGVCFMAPYFKSIKPRFLELKPGRAVITIKKRRAVTNHLKTVHAIAMCNMAELVGGMVTDVSVPDKARWIPTGMTVKYLKKAKTDLTAVANAESVDWSTAGEKLVNVDVTDTDNNVVFNAVITFNVRHD